MHHIAYGCHHAHSGIEGVNEGKLLNPHIANRSHNQDAEHQDTSYFEMTNRSRGFHSKAFIKQRNYVPIDIACALSSTGAGDRVPAGPLGPAPGIDILSL